MRIKNDQAGLTLVELLVTILVASIVTLSACTMLLFGLRINNQSTKTSMGQNTVQVLMEALEDVAAEAQDLNVENDADGWAIKDGTKTLFSYVPSHKTIYSGKAMEGETIIGTPFMKGVFASAVYFDDQLLTIGVQMSEKDSYSTSIYCRVTGKTDSSIDRTGEAIIKHLNNGDALPDGVQINVDETRLAFLKKLASQYGSHGEIKDAGEEFTYYSEWYLNDKGYVNNPSWNKNTPWCACYVSWALGSLNIGNIQGNARWYANVDEFAKRFDVYENRNKNCNAGDLIFFNFDEDAESDHVGVVLAIQSNYIYTIEGNSMGRVAVRKYEKEDSRIIGCAKLWN